MVRHRRAGAGPEPRSRRLVNNPAFQTSPPWPRIRQRYGYIVFYRAPIRRHTSNSEFDLTKIPAMPPVEILYVHASANPGLARAAVGLGARGLVIAGSGAGSAGPYRDELVALTAEGITVVRSARVGEGRVLAYGNGHEEGVIAADNLNPQKAARLLSLALAQSTNAPDIQRIFDEY